MNLVLDLIALLLLLLLTLCSLVIIYANFTEVKGKDIQSVPLFASNTVTSFHLNKYNNDQYKYSY